MICDDAPPVKLFANNLHLDYHGGMNQKKLSVQKSFKNILNKAGLKATPARMSALSYMKKVKKPVSAENIIQHMRNVVDQATVYRIVKNLKTRDIITQIDLRHNHAHYEFSDGSDHHHLVCVQCGRIEDVTGCGAEEMYKTILRAAHNFSEIRQHALEFYGVCKTCIKRKPAVSHSNIQVLKS